MADQFQAVSCSSGSRWSTGFEGPTMSASVSCSTELTDNIGRSFNWPAAGDMFEAKSRSCDESPASISNSSITFQDIQNSHVSAPVITAPMLDTAPQALDFGLSSPTIEWSQPFFSSGAGRAENSFHALLQEDVIPRPYVQPDSGIESNQIRMGLENSSLTPLKNMINRSSFLQDHHALSSNLNSFPLLSASGGLPSALLQGLLEPDGRLQRSFYDAETMNKNKSSIDYHEQLNESLQPSLVKLPQFAKALLPPKQQTQFANNNNPFWNPSASSVTEAHSDFHHVRPSPQLVQNEISCYRSNLNVKANSAGGGSFSTLEKKSGGEPALKKPRIEKSSPLPTCKVRKEKLGDRITALQQLVSPFGKTDTASVLHESIEYIKFLHDQVRVSSAPYLKNGHQMQQVKNLDKSKDCERQDQDLKSRGLCLVPISSTFAVANEIPTDFWTPTFVGTFR